MMRRSISHLPALASLAGALFLACPSLAVAANATDDVLWGDDIDVSKLSFTIEGETHIKQGFKVSKDPHSLTLKMSLASFGLQSPQLLVATGQVNGNQITWSFDEDVDIDLGGPDDIKRIYGWFKVEVTPYSWFEQLLCEGYGNCLRNAKLSIIASDVTVEGDTYFGIDWSKSGTIGDFDAKAGLRTPGISAMTGPTKVYANQNQYGIDQVSGIHQFIHLDSISPSTGTTIELAASVTPGNGVDVPPSVYVQPGETSAVFYATADAGVRGTFQVVATSSTTQEFVNLSIMEPKKSVPKPWNDIKEMVPWWELLLTCISCWDLVEWSDALGPVLSVEDTLYLIQGNEDPYLIDSPELAGAQIVDVGPLGWLTGLDELGTPFVAQYHSGELQNFAWFDVDESVGAFVPDRVDGSGTVAGHWVEGEGASYAVLWPSGALQALDLTVAVESSVVRAINDAGYVVGTGSDGNAFVAQTWDFSHFMVAPPEGAQATVLDAVNAYGIAAGHVVHPEVLQAAYTSGEGLITLPPGEGISTSWAAGITDDGDVLVNAQHGETRSAFAWSTEDGMLTDLDEFLPADTALHVTEVVQVMPGGLLLFHAENSDGVEGTFTAQM